MAVRLLNLHRLVVIQFRPVQMTIYPKVKVIFLSEI